MTCAQFRIVLGKATEAWQSTGRDKKTVVMFAKAPFSPSQSKRRGNPVKDPVLLKNRFFRKKKSQKKTHITIYCNFARFHYLQ